MPKSRGRMTSTAPVRAHQGIFRGAHKQKTLAFGAYPAVSLKEARAKRDGAKELLAKGCDPGEIKRMEKRDAKIAGLNTFEAIAREWFNARRAGWTVGSPSHSRRRAKRCRRSQFDPKPSFRQACFAEPF